MSQSNAKETVLMRIEIGMDSRTKKAFEEFKAKCSQTLDALSVIASQTKQADGGLLRAMEAEAANDAPAVECPNDDAVWVKQMGQWVFAGQDDKWQSGGVDCHGRGYLFNCKKERLITPLGGWMPSSAYQWIYIGDGFDNSDYERSLINRLPVNDVDYLTEPDDCTDALEQSNWLSESVAPITKTDLQSIFIKNLSTVLIQRMHSMDRFSEDDYHVGGDKLAAWDIIFDQVSKLFGIVINVNNSILSAFFLKAHCEMTGGGCAHNFHKNSLMSRANRTITEAELPAFLTALESCYVKSK